jgi:hypothetical protein
MLDLLDAEAARCLVLDNEALDLVVSHISRPDDRKVAPCGVADPLLLAVEDPGVALAFGGCRQAASRSRAHKRLGQTEAADLFEARHRRQPLLLLLFRSVKVDRPHRQPTVHAIKGTEGRVDAHHFHRGEAGQSLTSTSASIALKAEPADIQLFKWGEQFEGKGIFGPVLVNDRRNLGLHECADLFHERELFDVQGFGEFVKVAIRRR